MKDTLETILSAKKSMGFFGERQLLESGKKLVAADLDKVEAKYDMRFPEDIREYLLALGSGNVNDYYIPHTHMIHPLDKQNGKISGFVVFSSDSAGNYFAYDPKSDESTIYYCSYDPLGYAPVANNIESLLKLLIASEYDINSITRRLKLDPLI